MILYIFCLLFGSAYCQNSSNENSLFKGKCRDVDNIIYDNLNTTKFSGIWFNTASFASDSRTLYDCSELNFLEDNMGYTLSESYVTAENKTRIKKTYTARVDPTFDAGKRSKFIVSYETDDYILQYPFFILDTDYDKFAITYTCKNNAKADMHYVFVWVLTRTKDRIDEETLKNALLKYPRLDKHRQSFVFKNFSNASCVSDTTDNDSFTTNFT